MLTKHNGQHNAYSSIRGRTYQRDVVGRHNELVLSVDGNKDKEHEVDQQADQADRQERYAHARVEFNIRAA